MPTLTQADSALSYLLKLANFTANTDINSRYSLTSLLPYETATRNLHRTDVTVSPNVSLVPLILDDLQSTLTAPGTHDTQSLLKCGEAVALLKGKSQGWFSTYASRARDKEISDALATLNRCSRLGRRSEESCSGSMKYLHAAQYCLTAKTDDPSIVPTIQYSTAQQNAQSQRKSLQAESFNSALSALALPAIVAAQTISSYFRGKTSYADTALCAAGTACLVSQAGTVGSKIRETVTTVDSALRRGSQWVAEGLGGGEHLHLDLSERETDNWRRTWRRRGPRL